MPKQNHNPVAKHMGKFNRPVTILPKKGKGSYRRHKNSRPSGDGPCAVFFFSQNIQFSQARLLRKITSPRPATQKYSGNLFHGTNLILAQNGYVTTFHGMLEFAATGYLRDAPNLPPVELTELVKEKVFTLNFNNIPLAT